MVRHIFVLGFCAALCGVIPARASIVGIGSAFVSPDIFTNSGLGDTATVYDSGVRPFSFDGNTGSYEELVAPIPSNPFCANCLGFGLLVDLNPGSAFDLSTVRFGTWNSQTDVGYCSDCTTGGSVPNTVFRGSGNNVGFNFSGSTFAPGNSSTVLIVLTDATQYLVNGGIFFNDTNNPSGAQLGGQISSGFGGIATPAPEPSTFTLTGLAMLGLAALRRRRARLSI